MPKIVITEEMAQKLKEFRINYNIKAKDVAEHINKTAAYYSKLENAAIKTIEYSTFVKVLNFITNTDTGYPTFMESISENLSDEELKENIAFMNFDRVERNIPVPDSLIDYINNKIVDLHITSNDLVEYINQNEDLNDLFTEEFNLDDKEIKPNRWYSSRDFINKETDVKSFIVINLDITKLESLLSKNSTKSNWITLCSVMYHLLKLEHKDQVVDIAALQIEANDILVKHKFYSLTDKSKFAKQSKSKEEYDNLLNDFDKNNMIYVSKILSAIKFISDYDIKYANKLLEKISINIDVDPSFTLRFMAAEVSKLSDLSITAKKGFLNRVDKLIEETIENNSDQIEIFD